jgi:hypothetical protein
MTQFDFAREASIAEINIRQIGRSCDRQNRKDYLEAFARRAFTAGAEQMQWQPIETAPEAGEAEQDKILIIGGAWPKPALVHPDGGWWRMRTKEGSAGQPTHWMSISALPTEPKP